jgi:hypothetical protein
MSAIDRKYPLHSADGSPHLFGEAPQVLLGIAEPGVNLALWRRSSLPAVSRELLSLRACDLPDVRCTTTQATFDDDVDKLLRQHELNPADFGCWLGDLCRLAKYFFAVSAGWEVTLRLLTTADDDCRRFHFDRTRLRLLCTYRGPGTEWLTDAQVDRDAQRNGAANHRIVRFGEPERFEPFWAGILKGDAYPGNAGGGLMHRSPQIAGSGQTRVLFCLDC